MTIEIDRSGHVVFKLLISTVNTTQSMVVITKFTNLHCADLYQIEENALTVPPETREGVNYSSAGSHPVCYWILQLHWCLSALVP